MLSYCDNSIGLWRFFKANKHNKQCQHFFIECFMDTLVYENYIVCNILQGALFLRLESQ